MEKAKQIEEIKTVLKNNNINWEEWDLHIICDDIQCEITGDTSLKVLNKIQSELSNFEIVLSGNYNCGITLTFEINEKI